MTQRGAATARRWLPVLAFAAALGLVAYRIATHLNVAGQPATRHYYGLQDFRDGIYLPVAATLAGDNPYDRPAFERKYPVGEGLFLYSPLTLLLHAPFGLLSYERAELAYVLVTIALTVTLAAVSLALCGVPPTLASVCGLAALIVLSRPGNLNLFNGQVTLQAVLGTYVALWYGRTRPGIAGVALALTSFKPQFGLPLGLLMLARGDRRAVLVGIAVALPLTLLALAPIVARTGPEGFVSSVRATYELRQSIPAKTQATQPVRVDALALTARAIGRPLSTPATLAIGAALLALAGAGLRRLAERTDRSARVLSVSLAAMAIVACIYHNPYDLLALTLPFVALVVGGEAAPWQGRSALRWLALGLLTLLAVNYLATFSTAERLHLSLGTFLALSSLNNLAVLVLLVIHTAAALAPSR